MKKIKQTSAVNRLGAAEKDEDYKKCRVATKFNRFFYYTVNFLIIISVFGDWTN